ncbi:unnamed protein product [Soboliphyme baturini]|uniref:GPR1/FUN34/YaaH family protein n=1 Tax=Soboliphyme baturini TaxID=241478 RepID=A0A183ICR3_9BILA|nr:unnamed protein product [Soboliphyme baturini]
MRVHEACHRRVKCTIDSPSPESHDLQDLDEYVRNLVQETIGKREAEKPKYAQAATLGLAGFGLTTLLLQCHNFKWMGVGPIIWLGIVFGGLCQIIAGVLEFYSGDNFGLTAFGSYGAFWISFGLMVIGNHYGISPASATDSGFFLLAFCIFSVIMLVGAFGISMAMALTFLTLVFGISFLCVDEFVGIAGFKIAGAVFLSMAALIAWYMMAHLIYKQVFKSDLLPVGKPPTFFYKRYISKRYGRR